MNRRPLLFYLSMLALTAAYLLLKLGIPYFSMALTGRSNPLPVPETLFTWLMLYTIMAVVVYVTTSERRMDDFLHPLRVNRVARVVVMIVFPALVGWYAYSQAMPRAISPAELRIQHPTIPKKYERLTNPFRELNEEGQKAAIEEGRILYQINCRPCHGTKTDGNGPFADAFRLRPINFTDPGTIATLVESYAFWRIREGAFGLPPESTPWDSSMPAFEDKLSDEEIWKIIMAEYDTAGVSPRIPEKQEH
jgi:mono/diheme cytochrome c family protein